MLAKRRSALGQSVLYGVALVLLLATASRVSSAADAEGFWMPLPDYGSGRGYYSAVWTGSEMIVWGGSSIYPPLPAYGGARLDILTQSWKPVSNNGAPSGRWGHAAVWTGSEMVVWGGGAGLGAFGDGARYHPSSDTWTPVSDTGAPLPRASASTVWTGSEMIIWGGMEQIYHYHNDGARYNPADDTWMSLPLAGAPATRSGETAVWTGSEMIVWGGRAEITGEPSGDYLNTGARYNPGQNDWKETAVQNAPTPRSGHTAVWTGTEMIIWGGENSTGLLNDSARYDPAANKWTPIPLMLANTPPPLWHIRAVWTGSEVILVGLDPSTDQWKFTGARFDPQTSLWHPLPAEGAPATFETALWTGSQMIVWGPKNISWRVYTGNGAVFWMPAGWIYLPITRR